MRTTVSPLLLYGAAILLCSHWVVSHDSEADTSLQDSIIDDPRARHDKPKARHGMYHCIGHGGRCVKAGSTRSCKTIPIEKHCQDDLMCCAKEKHGDCPDCVNSQCLKAGGFCVKNRRACALGKIARRRCFCHGDTQGYCCVPGCANGWFSSGNTPQHLVSQHFCYIDDVKRNWADAKAECEAHNMILAEPTDPVAVRSYIVEKYDIVYSLDFTWLGAKASGTIFTWQSNSSVLKNTSPFWLRPPVTQPVTIDGCLLMLTNEVFKDEEPTTPYFSTSCGELRWTLCELPKNTWNLRKNLS